jgi:hypothetical protein
MIGIKSGTIIRVFRREGGPLPKLTGETLYIGTEYFTAVYVCSASVNHPEEGFMEYHIISVQKEGDPLSDGHVEFLTRWQNEERRCRWGHNGMTPEEYFWYTFCRIDGAPPLPGSFNLELYNRYRSLSFSDRIFFKSEDITTRH